MITISISESTAAELKAALASFDPSTAPTTTPPGSTPPSTTPPTVPSFYNPFPTRKALTTEMPWDSPATVYSGNNKAAATPLTDQNVWLLGITVPAVFSTGQFSCGEWQGQPWFRDLAIYRNRDGALVHSMTAVQTPSINFVPGTPAPRSGFVQLPPGERYTIVLTNHSAGGSSAMFAELHTRD